MSNRPNIGNTRMLTLAAIVIAIVGGVSAIVLLGGSDGRSGDLAAVQNPIIGAGGAQHGYIVKSSDPIYDKAPRVLSYPTGRDNDETTETGAPPVEPCRLVSRASASAILGGPVHLSQHPQGPTCVYSLQGSKRQVTLQIEHTQLGGLRRHARRASRLRVAGRAGWCLRYESTSVAVPLSGGRLLHVTGPCGAASRFAALALHEI